MSKKAPTRIVALDYGMARIGVAVSDESKVLASPFTTVQAARKSEETIKRLVDELQRLEKERGCTVCEVVVGLPLKLSGKHGLVADEVTAFVEALKKAIPAKVTTWDERLTTVQAERAMRESNMSRKKRAKVIDVTTAVIILQSYLDSLGGSILPPLPPMP